MNDSNNQPSHVYEIRPNKSLSPEMMIVFYVGIVLFSLIIAFRFWLLGIWMVLPFTLLEMLVLGISFFMFFRSSQYLEVIKIAPDITSITATQGVKVLYETDLQSHWVEVVLKKSKSSWYPSKLFLKSHNNFIPIGACLTENDRKSLAKTLKQALYEYRSIDFN